MTGYTKCSPSSLMVTPDLRDNNAEIRALLQSAIDNDQATIIMLETLQAYLQRTDDSVSELADIQNMIYRNAAILKAIRRLIADSASWD
jgi:hypothetical protein